MTITPQEYTKDMRDKEKFERYCASVLGHTVDEEFVYDEEKGLVVGSDDTFRFNQRTYDDLNQMAEVVEKLLDDANIFIENQKYPNKYMITRDGFKPAMRNFIISTMPESTKGKE